MQSSSVFRFNDRATNSGSPPGGPAVDNKVDNVADLVVGALDVGSPGTGLIPVKVAVEPDTVSPGSGTDRLTMAAHSKPMGCALIAAGRSGLPDAVSLNLLQTLLPAGPNHGSLGDHGRPSLANGIRGHRAGVQHNLLEQRHQWWHRLPTRFDVAGVGHRTRGPPAAREPSAARQRSRYLALF